MKNIEKETIERIKYHTKNSDAIKLAFSGGKDSIVILDLAVRTKINFTAEYSNTTIDPAGTAAFIRKYYPNVKHKLPPKSFYKLVQEKGLPNRYQRWCCALLKENSNKGYDTVITGVRRAESNRRSKYPILGNRKNITELRAIIDWSKKDVLDYIAKYKLPMIKYYSEPYSMTRLGCVMCPLATSHQMIIEAQLFPKNVKALIKSVKIFRDTHQHLSFVQTFNNEYDMVYLWLKQMLNQKGKEYLENSVFNWNSKIQLEKLTGIELNNTL